MLCACSTEHVEMVYVSGGEFKMGSDDVEADDDEKPLHSEVVNGFYIGKYEVSQAQWKRIMKNNPSCFQGDNLPVECVSWSDVQLFINKLNAKTGRNYRLPTETEWEYAAKGGGLDGKYKYSGSSQLEDVAWFVENSDSMSHVCGSRQPNKLGIYDMSGNVHEWCSDLYDSLSYTDGSAAWPDVEYVFRGGSWLSEKRYCRIANRNHNSKDLRHCTLGFRLAADSI